MHWYSLISASANVKGQQTKVHCCEIYNMMAQYDANMTDLIGLTYIEPKFCIYKYHSTTDERSFFWNLSNDNTL